MMERRRICWPEFDATCLEGGCVYCNDHGFQSVRSIRHAVEAMDHTRNRGNGDIRDPLEAFERGQRHNWGNADVFVSP